ncbi:UbiA family prenyltransferase [Burkholderia vietnamiensis]|uniref:UbiA family prenyltransferase n=1 Tax=Burkholderia vietnamiensis TaxID=60552 RepID=A0ABS1B497_BURVI|nr:MULTISPECIES: UbiA family prenyltransferase [Burkholderia]KVE13104.1 4-hydroxybenzoate polyprenyltransferase [Burkholderia vietnamiensis]KVF00808.1 4-hydroxybenzoate polyprenyltransferase [Burkholderia vietnamiensis]KVF32750.1 4-hydroxybenzoate polyprenyltransferase [Burkholderia vietnamiensis]KVF95552.1 4-hydroxybenzoate polyprenyltransferase [Burkholderia vietnamiensis]KVR93784.1 4-hydroxybenzoate polyprenyltransferase [Burkholderia vietnamiensis]
MQETKKFPLVVDLDGTLTVSDTLMESVIRVVKHKPANLLRLPFWLASGRAVFKAKIAEHADFRAEMLPYRESLIDYLVHERECGRKIVLATAAHRSIAERVNSHLGLFDLVIATCDETNLKGEAKLAAIRQQIGGDFVYAGDSKADLPVWAGANGAVLAGVSHDVAANVRSSIPVEQEFSNARANLVTWCKALRVHQWLKNLLLFVPLLTAFAFFDIEKVVMLALAFLSMSLGASATYIGNDLWDLDNDRRHPRKRNRPFASGALSITEGVGCAALLLTLAFALAFAVSVEFAGMFVLYLVLTTSYSWRLKSVVLLDVVVLSLLYTYRIIAGAVAAGIPVSHWLLAFSVLAFLSLALVKRCSELVFLRQSDKSMVAGRDYRVSDLEVLWPFGIGASLAAVVVFGLFINAPETAARYAIPHLLWLVQIGLIYLFGRLWIATVRGAMHDDPIVHILENRGSFGMLCIMVAIVLAAHFLPAL